MLIDALMGEMNDRMTKIEQEREHPISKAPRLAPSYADIVTTTNVIHPQPPGDRLVKLE